MQLEGKSLLIHLKRKNRGNDKLCKSIDPLIADLESTDVFWKTSDYYDEMPKKCIIPVSILLISTFTGLSS